MIDYHVHLWPHPELADEGELALERLSRYCDEAALAGVREVALTEHFFRFRQARAVVEGWWDDFEERGGRPFRAQARAYFDHHATADLDRYVEAALAARSAGLPVVVGLEVDYYPGRMGEVGELLSGYPFDVLLGSVHWIGNWMFDDLADPLQLEEWERRSTADAWRGYTEALEEMAGSGSCDVLAHPDLAKVAGRYPDGSVRDECEERIAEAAARSGLAAELNSAGMRKPCREDYPSPSLLGRFAARGVPVTFASDSHGPSRVAERVGDLTAAAAAAGYLSVRRFRKREGDELPFEPLPPATPR